MRAKSWAKRLHDRMKRSQSREYPMATVAFYGPDNRVASKVVASVLEGENRPPRVMKKWMNEDLDVRLDSAIGRAVEDFLRISKTKGLVVTRGIIGCPHEEGVDYPEGKACPECPLEGP